LATAIISARQGASVLTSTAESDQRPRGLPRARARPALLPAGPPQLLVMVDTEEEFDWSAPFDRHNIAVQHMADLPRLQEVFEASALTPTYIIDYPIAGDAAGAAFLQGLASSGRAAIGMQLHPWVTPPHEEAVNAHNSYCCNLPAELEVRKLQALHDIILARIGLAPVIFKSGRYGVAHDTLEHLRSLGLRIDTSAIPGYDLSRDGGPDYSDYSTQVQWFDTPAGPMLEIPTTGGYIGALRRAGPMLTKWISTPLGRTIKLEPLLSRLSLMSRVRLSPEGYTLAEMQQLTCALHLGGEQVFSLSLHSPSAGIGHTPYVRSAADRARLFACIRNYVAWFRNDFGGITSTPLAILQQAGG
jgi:hypothetical protein